jgi:glycosyltransferase involved in cell wall biosynthesis
MNIQFRDTLIVLPALNEMASVAQVIEKVKCALPSAGILVVDDGSTDQTALVARKAGAQVLTLPFNLGVGGAMRLGFRYALDKGFKSVVQIDADGQHDPACVPKLISKLADYDLVIGARFAGEGDYVVRGPRKWAMQVLSKILSKVTSTRLTDTTSGLKASGPRAIELFAKQYPAEYLGDTIEALVIASRAGLRITQVPVEMMERTTGTPSHNPIKSAFQLGRASLALFFALIRPYSAKSGTSTS